MNINGKKIEDKAYVIAEVGNNHEGSFSLAKEMVHAAAESKADAVKFQTFKTELFISPHDNIDRYNRLKKFQLSFDQFQQLSELSNSLNITFLSTPLDLESAQFLNEISPVFKIASGDNNFTPLLEQVAGYKKPLILSTGASDLRIVKNAYDTIKNKWNSQSHNGELAILHCVSAYPAPANQSNLNVIKMYQKEFPDITVGYSDHTIGIEAAKVAYVCGAKIIEKHFTLDKNYSDFRDHQLSADPNDLKSLISSLNEIHTLLGNSNKEIQECEGETRMIRRSLFAKNKINTNTEVLFEDLNWLRPGTGITPENTQDILGKKVTQDITEGDQISLESFK